MPMVGFCAQPADSKAGEAAAHGAGCQRASCRPSCETDLQALPRCWMLRTAARWTNHREPTLHEIYHTEMHTDTNAHSSHPEKECLQLNQICHNQFGVKISARLAASSESQHICWIPNRVKTKAIFQAVTLQSLCSFPKLFFTLTTITQKSFTWKMH